MVMHISFLQLQPLSLRDNLLRNRVANRRDAQRPSPLHNLPLYQRLLLQRNHPFNRLVSQHHNRHHSPLVCPLISRHLNPAANLFYGHLHIHRCSLPVNHLAHPVLNRLVSLLDNQRHNLRCHHLRNQYLNHRILLQHSLLDNHLLSL